LWRAPGSLRPPSAIARNVYVVEPEANSIAVIDSLTNQLVGAPIPQHIAITPDGHFAYLSHTSANTVTVLDTQTGQPVGSPIAVGEAPWGIAFTSDGKFAYVANVNSGTISVIDTQIRAVVGAPITPGAQPRSDRDHPRRQAGLRRQSSVRQGGLASTTVLMGCLLGLRRRGSSLNQAVSRRLSLS
jgi:YVTN family beta-propeller protein